MNYDIKVLYSIILSKHTRIEEVKQVSDKDGAITITLTGEYTGNPPATFYDTLILIPTKKALP